MSENIYKYFIAIVPLVLITIGIFGNSIVFYILTRPKLIKETVYRYFIVTEIVDALNLTLVLIWFIAEVFKIITGVLACKILQSFAYLLFDLYPWISTLNSIDRLLSIKYRSKFELRKQLKFQALAVGSICVVLVFTNIPIPIYFSLNNETICLIIDKDAGFQIYLGKILTSQVLPFFIKISSTITAVEVLLKAKRQVLSNNFRREIQFLKNVIIMDVWFLICYMPIFVVNLLRYKYSINYYEYWNMLHSGLGMLPMLQSSCNIFVFLFCNKRFRDEFVKLCKNYGCYFKISRSNQI
jgi:hypothetical protein